MRSIWESIVSWLVEADEEPKKIKHAGDWETELGGQAQVKGTPAIEPDELPKPVQGPPGAASGIGAGRIAAKNAEPTSVSLGARARQVEPGVSGIKQRYGVNANDYFSDAPVKVDPTTGKTYGLRGRPRKDQPSADELELQAEPFKAQHAAALGRDMSKKPDKSKIHTYDAGSWKDTSGTAHKPKDDTGAERPGSFGFQRNAPAGHTKASEDEWEKNPSLAARRMGGKGNARLSYNKQDVGQRGRMSVQSNPGKGTETTYNPYTGEWETADQMQQSLQNPDIRAKIAAKLAMRGADIANKRFGQERRPHASRASAEPLGNVVPKDADTQKKDAAAAAIASKPLGINTRRDDGPKGTKQAPAQSQGQSTGSADAGPVDRSKMKQMIAQRLAAMAAKKNG